MHHMKLNEALGVRDAKNDLERYSSRVASSKNSVSISESRNLKFKKKFAPYDIDLLYLLGHLQHEVRLHNN
jgi:hypothetical protein